MDIDKALLKRLHEQADKVGISANTLLTRLLDELDSHPTPQKQISTADRLNMIIRGTRAGTWEWNVQTGETIFNDRWAEIIGYSLEDLQPTDINTWISYTHPDDLQESDRLLNLHFAGELPYYECEARMKHKDGHWVWVVDRGMVMEWTEDGKPLWMFGTHMEIDERKQAEQQLKEAEQRYRTVLELSTNWTYWQLPDGEIRYSSPASEQITGYTADEIRANPAIIEKMIHDDDRAIWNKHHHDPSKTVKSSRVQFRICHKNGSTRWIEHRCRPVISTQGEFNGYRVSNIDITELKQTNIHLETIIHNIPVMISYFDVDGQFQFLNSHWIDTLGWTIDDMQQHDDPLTVLHPDPDYRKAMQDYMLLAKPGWREFQLHTKFGTTIDTIWANVRLSDGRTIGIGRDITENKDAERQLRDHERFISGILNAVPSFIYIYDFDVNANVFANDGLTTILGYTPIELQAMGSNAIPSLVHPDDIPALMQSIARVRALSEGVTDIRNYQINYRLKHKDGSWRWIQDQGIIYKRDDTGKVTQILGSVIDINERMQAEAELLKTRERYATLSNLTIEGVALHNGGYIIDANRAFAEMFGYTLEELQGKQAVDLVFPPDSREIVYKNIREEVATPYEVMAARKDGTQFPVEIEARQLNDTLRVTSLRDITIRKQAEAELRIKDAALASSITAIALADLEGKLTYVNDAFLTLWKLEDESQALGRSVLDFWTNPNAAEAIIEALVVEGNYVGELTALLSDGTHADIALAASLVTDADDYPISLMGSFNDITRQKQAESFSLENERLKARFKKEQQQNLLIQRIISALSHDLRTPLTVIASSKDMLMRYHDQLSAEKRLDKLETIGRHIQFALNLIEDTVTMVRGNLNEPNFKPLMVNLAALCQVSIDEVNEAHGNTHTLTLHNPDNIGTVMVDEVLISRILLNLLSNAIKYSPESSEIRLELARHKADDERLILRVVDNGMGIDEALLPRIFEPFYRTDNVRAIEGTGLGLSIVKDCVERHQGNIRVESVPGEGSTFTIELPTKFYVPATNG